MAFTTNLSGVTQVDDSVILAYDQAYLVAVGQDNVMDQFVTHKRDVGAKSISLPRYARLDLATTPLSEVDDVVSDALADTAVILTPLEYGKVVTKTNLASLQTGGTIDLAAAQLVGMNHGSTMDALAINALDGSAFGDSIPGVATGTFLNKFYNKLARASVPTIDGAYVMIAHDDVIADLRADTSAGSWVDVTKYATPETVLKNEVGMFKGFRVVRDNNATNAAGVYNSYFVGFNALGKATSQDGRMVATGPFDKLNRFVNVGWYEVSKFGIVDQDALWVGQCTSSM